MKHILSLFIAILAFSGCNHFFGEKRTPEQALLGDAAVVVFSKDGAWMLQFMESEFPLLASKEVKLFFPDSVGRTKAKAEMELIFGKKHFLSFYEREGVSVSLLAMELSETRERKVVEFIKQVNGKTGDIPSRKYNDVRCYSVEKEKDTCYFAVKDAVLLISASLPLLQESIDNQDNEGNLCHNEQYRQATQLWGRNVNANIYISYPKAAICFDVSFCTIFKELETMALWSSFDISKKENLWIFNGYTNPSDQSSLKDVTALQPTRIDKAKWKTANTGYYYTVEHSANATGETLPTSSLKRKPLYSQISHLMDETCHWALYYEHLDKQALSVQFSDVDGLFYSNFIWALSPDNETITQIEVPKPEINEEPETNEQPEIIGNDGKIIFDGKMILSPSVFVDKSSKRLSIIAFDDKQQVYMIEKNKGILFKKTLDELPVSKAYEMEDDGGKKYVFNTKNYLYVIDSKGNDVAGFPLELSVPAQNPVAMFDFQGKKDYAIAWVDTKGVVQCLDKNGEKRQGWSSPTLSGNISKELQYCAKKNTNYLIAALDNGNVMLYDRQGKTKLTVKSSFHNNPRTAFYINETNYQKGVLLTTDKKGALIYVPEKGNVSTTVFGTFSEQHQFIYSDVNNDGHYDFIYLDKNELKIFDRFKNVTLKYAFSKNADPEMDLFVVNNKKYIVASALKENKIYLFDNKGLKNNFTGTTKAYLITDPASGAPLLIVGNEKELAFYSM